MEGDDVALGKMMDIVISIHTLRMEGDCDGVKSNQPQNDFNPHPPYGGWPMQRGYLY